MRSKEIFLAVLIYKTLSLLGLKSILNPIKNIWDQTDFLVSSILKLSDPIAHQKARLKYIAFVQKMRNGIPFGRDLSPLNPSSLLRHTKKARPFCMGDIQVVLKTSHRSGDKSNIIGNWLKFILKFKWISRLAVRTTVKLYSESRL